jgi:hypothetical protein
VRTSVVTECGPAQITLTVSLAAAYLITRSRSYAVVPCVVVLRGRKAAEVLYLVCPGTANVDRDIPHTGRVVPAPGG